MRTGQDPMPGLAQGLTMLFDLRRPELLSFIAEAVRGGGLPTFPAVLELSELVDSEVLDVPGRPRVVHVPGHTPGSCALHLAGASTVFTGDALITHSPAAPAWRRRGPQLVKDSWQEDAEQAFASLDRLAGLDARTVLPGHGEPWHGGIDAAVDHARHLGRV
jgi:glyoxylase-like metal-dependent hydrolase (beta-lactamase superfamily II)